MDKIKGLWTRYVPRISRRANTSLKVVYLYGAGLLILFFMVLFSWLHDFYRTGAANTAQLITFFKEYAAPAVVGAVTFISIKTGTVILTRQRKELKKDDVKRN